MRLMVGVLLTLGLIYALSSEPWSALSAAKSVTSSGEADFAPDGLYVISWNIQVFGRSKASKPQVMAHIMETLQHYDLIAIQEIRDKSQTAIQQLLEALNNANPWWRTFSAQLVSHQTLLWSMCTPTPTRSMKKWMR